MSKPDATIVPRWMRDNKAGNDWRFFSDHARERDPWTDVELLND
jgi:hypothetical protein